jgi:hypothetical protein
VQPAPLRPCIACSSSVSDFQFKSTSKDKRSMALACNITFIENFIISRSATVVYRVGRECGHGRF